MQVNERCPPGRLGKPVGHGDHRTFMQAQDVTEVLRKILQERKLIGTRITEYGGQSLLSQDIECCSANALQVVPGFFVVAW